jgi:protein tyrosine phosphatase (PTP) superfamily phosphohydrolase (DUF442 family)
MSFLSRLSLSLLVFGIPVFAGDVPGIKNFDKVSDTVYRGGQPTNDGFRYLAGLGVKRVVDLREADGRSEAERRTVTAAGMMYISVPMTGLTPPTEAEITKLLSVLEDRSSGPVFVHCKRGADRTGAVIAAYHINHDKWTNDKALKDAMAHHMSFFQFPRQGFIRSFQARTIDASAAPAQAGATTPAPAAAATATKN